MTDTTDQLDTPDEKKGIQVTDTPSLEDTDVTAERSPDDDRENHPSKREARYRVQLRETEAERDQLRANVEAFQRAEVERIAGESIQKPSALWSADVGLVSLLDDAGRVDPLKVDTAVQAARDTLGLAPTRPPGYVRGEGQVVDQPPAGNPWQNAFTG